MKREDVVVLPDKKHEVNAESVCGGKLKDAAGYPRDVYRGEQVYFCTRACLRAFEQNPDAFMAGEIEHPLDDE